MAVVVAAASGRRAAHSICVCKRAAFTPVDAITKTATHPTMSDRPNKSTINGCQHAATHAFPNEDLSNFGPSNGWPAGLFGPERSRALIEAGITTFTQLRAAVRCRTKEQFYADFGTCDGRVGALGTAANTMWEVVTVWEAAHSERPRGQGASSTDAWLVHADTHRLPAEDLKLGAGGGWPPGAMGEARIQKLRDMHITTTSQLMTEALTLSYDQFLERFGGRDGALDSRAGGFYGFLHRSHAAGN